MAYPESCEEWGGPSSITPLELALVTVRHFPRGTVEDNGLSVRVTAYAVASAESGKDPLACGDRFQPIYSLGLWQINGYAHRQYDLNGLLEADYNAEAAVQVSSGGQNWHPWSVYTEGTYQQYLAEAETYIALAEATVIIIPPGAPPGVPAGVADAAPLVLGLGLLAVSAFSVARIYRR